MTRLVPNQEIILVGESAVLITDNQELSANDIIIGQSDTEEVKYSVLDLLGSHNGLKKNHRLFILSALQS